MTNHKRQQDGCEVQPNHILINMNGYHLKLCSFRYMRIVDTSYMALLVVSVQYAIWYSQRHQLNQDNNWATKIDSYKKLLKISFLGTALQIIIYLEQFD